MPEPATLFLFVKGTAQSDVEKLVAHAQVAASLDTLERVRAIPEIDTLVVATANADLAARAAAFGARIDLDAPNEDFHWGERLAALVDKYRARVPIYIGGGSGALMSTDDWRAMIQRVLQQPNIILTNNYYSCDFAAWSPGSALRQIEPPTLDNDLAYRLGNRTGLQIVALPKNAATQLDIDTPTDLVTISFHPSVGKHLRSFLDRVNLDSTRGDQVLSLLGNHAATGLIAGRVSASMALFLEHETRCQWRIYSEERGMRASGRQARGEVHSLLGYFLEQNDARGFFAALARLADAAIVDSRVLFAHRRLHPTAVDRFSSDLLLAEEIGDPFIREFTHAARQASMPVLLGGHSLVSGGMYALAEASNAMGRIIH